MEVQNGHSNSTLVTKKINETFDSLFTNSKKENLIPHVCILCDEFLNSNNKTKLKLETLKRNYDILITPQTKSLPSLLKKQYYFNGSKYDNTIPWKELLLSPRAHVITTKIISFSCCKQCSNYFSKSYMPKYAISNNYYFGVPPECMMNLTDVELAMLSITKTFGYCFCYTGGAQKQLKGSLTYYKVDIENIAKSLCQLSILGLTDNIVILIHGKMTKEQRERAKQKNKIRVNLIMETFHWLCQNNDDWKTKNLNLDEIKSKLKQPKIIDNSILVESQDNNVETTESFQVFFPDGTVNECSNGQENLEDFKKIVKTAKLHGYNIEFQCDLQHTIVSDYKDKNFVNSSILQFPFGKGGINEMRQLKDGTYTKNVNIFEYITHLSKISQPQFQTQLFTLILFNMKLKNIMVRKATWKCRYKEHLSIIGKDLQEKDILDALQKKN